MSKTNPTTELRALIGDLTGEDQKVLSQWEKNLKKHEMFDRWAQHPVTVEVFKELEGMLATMTARLSTEEGMTEVERQAIFKAKPALLFLLTIPQQHTVSREQLEKTIMLRTKEFETYRGSHPLNI